MITNEDRDEALAVVERLRDDDMSLGTDEHETLCNWLHWWVSEVDTIEELSDDLRNVQQS